MNNNNIQSIIVYVKLIPSPKTTKKYRMIFYDEDKNIVKYTDFGANEMSDFTLHKDEDRKNRWLNRFNKLINKYEDDPTKPMTLSHLILWNKKSLNSSYNDYRRKFNLKKVS
jgi:hypothetical protein